MNIYMLLSFQSKNFSTHEHLSNVYTFIVYLYNYIMITLQRKWTHKTEIQQECWNIKTFSLVFRTRFRMLVFESYC